MWVPRKRRKSAFKFNRHGISGVSLVAALIATLFLSTPLHAMSALDYNIRTTPTINFGGDGSAQSCQVIDMTSGWRSFMSQDTGDPYSYRNTWNYVQDYDNYRARLDAFHDTYTANTHGTSGWGISLVAMFEGRSVSDPLFDTYHKMIRLYTFEPDTQFTISDYAILSNKGLQYVDFFMNPNAGCRSQVWDVGWSTHVSTYYGKYFVLATDHLQYPVDWTGGPLPTDVNMVSGLNKNIQYLALGDSFSSGEGDTGQQQNSSLKYYREHTDDNGITVIGSEAIHDRPTEKCHLSTRSYPYILANGMDLGGPTNTPTTPWQSVACSGATAWDVKEHAFDNYLGQGDRLKGYDYDRLKTQGLNEFIPGRQKQIEFVKKYQPKVITLTMGGNDVDFGGKLDKCVRKITTCEYATVAWREKMRNELARQFTNLSSLYEELSIATEGRAKIYVLGYPIFINGNPYAKCTNVFNLDNTEREFINNSIIYLNNIIEQAAKKAGVKYIDVENAFGNHRLCDTGTQHVTAVTNVFGANGNEQQEGFHPNHFGQVDLANAVWAAVDGQSLLDYQTCSDPSIKVCPNASVTAADAIIPPYFTEGIPADNTEIHYYTLTNGTLVKMIQTYDVHTQTMVFKSESKVDITLYSDPTSLGQVTVASDGSVSTQITIPLSVPAGYHTLVLRGQSPDGMPIELYQTVEVRGSSPNDIDEDGIDDAVDKCAYITPLNIDTDHDSIDDACDPEVNVPEAPYRLRLGDPTRTYAGQPEKSNYLYLERSVNATILTGISGDDDPDGDGWAIVGASSGKGYSTTMPTSIPDTAPYANFTMSNYDPAATTPPTSQIIPSIYLRAGDYGCVEYQPTSLVKVLPSETRTLTLTAQGLTGTANHCRSEPATADTDHDGRPDSTQPLYMARNGDTTKGEDPTRTYLFRNFYAAEAQLGVTDYTPAGTPANTPDKATQPIQPWNLLATSKDVGYSPVFNHLTITTDSLGKPWPIITARKHSTTNPSSGICIAYQPDSQANTTNIKLATQPIRQLQLMKRKDIPEGVGCE